VLLLRLPIHNVQYVPALDLSARAQTHPPGLPFTLALPPAGGTLPYWLLFTSAASIYNAAQNYFVLWQTKEIYSGQADQGESGALLHK
jgi:hypothetical protein